MPANSAADSLTNLMTAAATKGNRNCCFAELILRRAIIDSYKPRSGGQPARFSGKDANVPQTPVSHTPVPQSFGDLVRDDEPPFGEFEPQGLQWLARKICQIPPLHRGNLRRPLANLVRRLSNGPYIDVHYRGAAFRLRPSANIIEDALLIHPSYNHRELDFLMAGTPRGGVFVDLGSNVGFYSLTMAAHIGPEGKVVSVDANPDMAAALVYNAQASGFEHVQMVNVAVGESRSRADLFVKLGDLAIVNVAENPDGQIEIRPLADIVRGAGLTHVDSLKADIEGFEDQALIPYLNSVEPPLKPKRMTLEHTSRHEWKNDLFPVLEKHGYRLVTATKGNSFFER